MKRIKIQRGYLAKKQPKKAKYYDQSLGTNAVLPPRELLMHKTREEKDMGRLLTYVNALQSLSKPEKPWYEGLAKKSKNVWNSLFGMSPFGENDRVHLQLWLNDHYNPKKVEKKDDDEDENEALDDSRIRQILRDIEQSRKKENISKYFLERDRERYRRVIPSDNDDDDYDDDDDDEDEGVYDDSDDDSDNESVDDGKIEDPYNDKKAIVLFQGRKNGNNPRSNIAVTTVYGLVDGSPIRTIPNELPLVVKGVNAGTTATPLSDANREEVIRSNIAAKSSEKNQEMEQEDLFRQNLNKILTKGRLSEQVLSEKQMKLLASNPALLNSYLNSEVPSGVIETWTNWKEKKDRVANTALNDYLKNYEYVLKSILPRAITQLGESATRKMVGESSGKMKQFYDEYLKWMKQTQPNVSTDNMRQYMERLDTLTKKIFKRE